MRRTIALKNKLYDCTFAAVEYFWSFSVYYRVWDIVRSSCHDFVIDDCMATLAKCKRFDDRVTSGVLTQLDEYDFR